MTSLFVTLYVFVCCIPFFFIGKIGLVGAAFLTFFLFVFIGGIICVFLRKKPPLRLPTSQPINATTTPDYKIKIVI